jgi:pimeloyl-ACP methyl ester carboxylesterase
MTAPANTAGERPKRAFTPARIVALALIGLAMAGLAYLRFAPDSSVSVPNAARAGDLSLHPCTYDTEKGSYAADCGTLVVPENRGDPQSRLIALPVTRIKARSQNPGEPIFRLEGGPGQSNMHFSKASRFAGDHDVVLVGYRGVDGSVRLDCPEVESALKRSTDLLGEKSFRAYGDALRSCADRLTDEGVELAGYDLADRVDDLEAARKALDYDRIDLLSESAGTRYAMVYAWRDPESIHRSVMIGVNPPGHFLWDAKTTDEQIRRYAVLCSKDEPCGRRTDDLVATLRKTVADMPGRWLFLPIEASSVRIASFYGLMESTAEAAPLSAPMTLDAWLSASKGDAGGFWLQSLLADVAFPESFVWGELAAMGSQDAPDAEAYYAAGGGEGSILGSPGADFIWARGALGDAWPANPDDDEYRQVRSSNVETLLVGGELDFATPPQAATKELLPYLPNGRQVVLPELGHTIDFWSYQPEAGTRLIETYLESGRVDDSLYEPAKVDFTPSLGFGAIAKIVLGVMLGLAALTVVSLLWMARRLHWQGHFGRKTGVFLRSVYPIVLGVGGWFLGLLIVITTMPSVPLDDELLAALSVGLPIGLGIYFAWVNRDWSARTKLTGFAAAVGAALVGGWLGFNATEDLLALVTTIVGASVGANLALVLLDIAWGGRARDRFVAPTAKDTLEARPSTG